MFRLCGPRTDITLSSAEPSFYMTQPTRKTEIKNSDLKCGANISSTQYLFRLRKLKPLTALGI